MSRWPLSALASLLLLCGSQSAQAAATLPAWETLYAGFTRHFVEAHGRVVDHDRNGESTSEGQAYAAFFALLADDRQGFARIVEWTFANLADGKPGEQSLAWRWGRDEAGHWRVLDGEPATDADLWLAYALLEAGRLWSRDDYHRLGLRLLAQIAGTRVILLDGWGPTLLPGSGAQWRTGQGIVVNPSYLPSFLLARLAQEDGNGPWQTIRRDLPSLIAAVSPRGFAPDWVRYRPPLGWQAWKEPLQGSYDAIRCYLWAGIAADDDHVAARIRESLHGMADVWRRSGSLPEHVNVLTGATQGDAPVGYRAALLPLLLRQGETAAARAQLAALASAYDPGTQRISNHYYDTVLALFALAWQQGRLRVDANGYLRLDPATESGN